jgi:hypothetical protein
MKLEEILRMLSSRSLSSNGGFTLRKKYLPEYVPMIDSRLMCGDARAFRDFSLEVSAAIRVSGILGRSISSSS